MEYFEKISNFWQMLAFVIPACFGILVFVIRHWIKNVKNDVDKETKVRTKKRDGEVAKLEEKITEVVDLASEFNEYKVEEMELKTELKMKVDSIGKDVKNIAKNQISHEDFNDVKTSVKNTESQLAEINATLKEKR